MATALEPVGTRVSAAERDTFRRTCEAIGTTPSGAIRIFVNCFNDRGGFPFTPRRAEYSTATAQKAEPFETEEEAMEFIDANFRRMLNEAW